jgi:hypothetical protein
MDAITCIPVAAGNRRDDSQAWQAWKGQLMRIPSPEACHYAKDLW